MVMEQQNFQQSQQSSPQQQPSQQQPAIDPGKTLGIVGFIMPFVGLSPVGLILSIIGHNKSKKAGIDNKLSFAGIIINAVFLFLSVIAIVISIALMVVSYSGINAIEDTAAAKTTASATQFIAEARWTDNGSFPDEISDFTSNTSGQPRLPVGIIILSNLNNLNNTNGHDTVMYQYSGSFGNATGGRIMYWDFTNNKISDTPIYIGAASETSEFNNIH